MILCAYVNIFWNDACTVKKHLNYIVSFWRLYKTYLSILQIWILYDIKQA